MLFEICNLLVRARLDITNEKRTQRDIERLFKNYNIDFEREVHLSDYDIVDFMVGGIAIEVKLKGANKKAVFKQLCRYAKHNRVTDIILPSNTGMGLPQTIENKPVFYIPLGSSWL